MYRRKGWGVDERRQSERRPRPRHPRRDAPRVLGGGRGGSVPPARRRRGGGDAAARRPPGPALRRRGPRAGTPRGGDASTPTCSLSRRACCPRQVSQAAHVRVTRVEPEIFVPPLPGTAGAAGDGRRPRPGAVLRLDGAPGARSASPATASPSSPTSTSSTAPGAPTSTSRGSRVSPPRPPTRRSCCTACSPAAPSGVARPTGSSSTSRARTCCFSTSRTRVCATRSGPSTLKLDLPVVAVRRRADPGPRAARLARAPPRHGQPAGRRLGLLLDHPRVRERAPARVPVRGIRRREQPAVLRDRPRGGEARAGGRGRGQPERPLDRGRGPEDRDVRRSRRCADRPGTRRGRQVPRRAVDEPPLPAPSPPSSAGSAEPPPMWAT